MVPVSQGTQVVLTGTQQKLAEARKRHWRSELGDGKFKSPDVWCFDALSLFPR